MRKFNDILNENNEGNIDNKISVELIVKDYDFIHNFLFEHIKKELNSVSKDDLIYEISDDSFNSTILYDSKNEPYLKYLNVTFAVSLNKLTQNKYDIGSYFTELREKISKSFKLKDNKIIKTGSIEQFSFSMDYDAFLKSDLYKSVKGIDKYKL